MADATNFAYVPCDDVPPDDVPCDVAAPSIASSDDVPSDAHGANASVILTGSNPLDVLPGVEAEKIDNLNTLIAYCRALFAAYGAAMTRCEVLRVHQVENFLRGLRTKLGEYRKCFEEWETLSNWSAVMAVHDTLQNVAFPAPDKQDTYNIRLSMVDSELLHNIKNIGASSMVAFRNALELCNAVIALNHKGDVDPTRLIAEVYAIMPRVASSVLRSELNPAFLSYITSLHRGCARLLVVIVRDDEPVRVSLAGFAPPAGYPAVVTISKKHHRAGPQAGLVTSTVGAGGVDVSCMIENAQKIANDNAGFELLSITYISYD